MAQRTAAQVAAALLAKGMTATNSHHTMFKMDVEGVTTVVTRMSHANKPINDSLARLMGKQCYLQLREFWDLVDCPLSADDWVALIKDRIQDGRNPYMPHR